MSEINNVIRIINFLRMKRIRVTADEISDELGISNSTVRRLIKSIDPIETGIWIESFQGKYGGFQLSGKTFINKISLSKKEKNAIRESVSYVSKKSGFNYHDDYISGLNKVLIQDEVCDVNKLLPKTSVLFRSYNEPSSEEERVTELIINGIESKRKIIIKYYSLSNNSESERVVHPYKIYTYKGFNYLAAFCEKRQEVRDFKISRIRNLILLNKTFENSSFSFENFVKDTFGIYKGDIYSVKLEISYPHAELVREALYHPDQNIISLKNGNIIFEAEMRGKEEIISWILSMGDCVKIIKPEEIALEVKNIYKNIYKNLDL